MARLLIATTNCAKLAEYGLLLASYGLELLSPGALGIAEEPEETGASFAENALLKARFYFERAGIATLADDGGLEVDALGGAPGIDSHRWLGAGVSDEALAAAVIERMTAVPEGQRGARIRCALALRYRRGAHIVEQVSEAALEGVIARALHRPVRPGFPYRAVLYLPARRCYLGELGDAEEARIGQRRQALEQAAPWLSEIAQL